jgi:hypothetical protein
MSKPELDRESILKELQEILQELESSYTQYNYDKNKLQQALDKHKTHLEYLCGIYEELDLPEIDNFEFHESYSEEYKNSKKEEYLELYPIDRQLYKCYVYASNYEYLILERIGILEGEEIQIAGFEVFNKIKKVFEELE